MDDPAIAAACGQETFRRGLEYARSGHVRQVTWSDSGNTLTAVVQGNRPHPYVVSITSSTTAAGRQMLLGQCTCPMGLMCKHVAATLIVARDHGGAPGPERPASSWRLALDAIAIEEADLDSAPIALQFTVQPPLKADRYSRTRMRHRLGARPMLMGTRGRWVASEISWQRLRYLGSHIHPEHARLVRRLLAMHPTTAFSYYGAGSQWLDVGELDGRSLWTVLQDARASGMPLLMDDKAQSPVTFIDEPTEVAFDIIRHPSGICVTPELWVGEEVLSYPHLEFIGQPASAAFAWLMDEASGKADEITLLAISSPIPDSLVDLLVREDSIEVPLDEEADFVLEGYPALARHYRIGSQDGSFVPPMPPQPTLQLVIQHHRLPPDARPDRAVIGPMIELQWAWAYLGGDPSRQASAKPQPLWAPPGQGSGYRDLAAEREVLTRVEWLLEGQPDLVIPGQARLAAHATLTGRAMLKFLNEDLDRIRLDPGISVIEDGAAIAYVEALDEPAIDLSLQQRPDSWDWFDLQVAVSVAGEEIPFEVLFRALATGQELLFLPSGTYVSLDAGDPERRERLERLRALIEEARALRESTRDSLGISRYQVDLWEDLVALGVIDEQSNAWQQALGRLARSEGHRPAALPDGALLAQPRPYQYDGFAWLSFLRANGLGGVLADDMGLGKTLQAIMAMVEGRESGDAPYLVVAPTSVMGNWARECARFAPGLRTVLITETSKRRGDSLAHAIAGSDVVITSYALFRLDFEEFECLEWSGLWLDEAQFTKNRQSQAYACARRLRTPFKVAITGTPMENNLMELWSLLSITAPGLFPNPDRFADYYQRPIERELDRERLSQLRRRIRPFMLRRTKEAVADDLPVKQEQVLELDLHPKHHRVYQRHLQAERQKVLGLIGDLRKHRFEIFRSLTMLRQLSLDASLVDDAYASIPSTKLDALVEMLDDIVAEGHRTLVFSQFTGYLAKVRSRLGEAGIPTSYLDGRTRKRQEAIDAFVDGSAPVFLISLKAGGFGLNLTAADYVILLDPWWNPATEAQAIDRTHRIGQDKKVMVYRMVARETIEERVMAMKEHKSALFDAVMTGSSAKGPALTAEEIRDLLA